MCLFAVFCSADVESDGTVNINVDCIALHLIKRGISDSIAFKYDETKMDKTGEFVQENNCYSNPFNPFVCVFTALGCYLSIYSEMLEKTENLFIPPGTKYKTAAQNFARQIGAIGQRHADTIKKYLRLSHVNIHGLRKGSGTHAASLCYHMSSSFYINCMPWRMEYG
jgi:hypothetical protein